MQNAHEKKRNINRISMPCRTILCGTVNGLLRLSYRIALHSMAWHPFLFIDFERFLELTNPFNSIKIERFFLQTEWKESLLYSGFICLFFVLSCVEELSQREKSSVQIYLLRVKSRFGQMNNLYIYIFYYVCYWCIFAENDRNDSNDGDKVNYHVHKQEFKWLGDNSNEPRSPSSYAFAKAIKQPDNLIKLDDSSTETR